MDPIRIVNMTELAELLGITTPTLRDWLRKYDDFPVEARGDHGVAYEFDSAKVAQWRLDHKAALALEDAERAAEIKQMRLDWAGEPVVDDPTLGLPPTERRAELDAQRQFDLMAIQRDALLTKTEVDGMVRHALTDFTKALRQIGPDLARDHNLDRPLRIAIDARIRQAMNDTVDRLQPMLKDADVKAA